MHRENFFSSCFRKQGSSYTRCRRTSVKYGACRCFCYISLLCVVAKGNKKMQHFWISEIPRGRDPFYKHIVSAIRKFSKPGKHPLFYNVVPILLYTRQFLWFSYGDSLFWKVSRIWCYSDAKRNSCHFIKSCIVSRAVRWEDHLSYCINRFLQLSTSTFWRNGFMQDILESLLYREAKTPWATDWLWLVQLPTTCFLQNSAFAWNVRAYTFMGRACPQCAAITLDHGL